MLIHDVATMPPLGRFLYWARERHQIRLRRLAGQPKPWTDDHVLQSYFFTHPFREHDKVTEWFRDNVREPLSNDPRVLFATVAFRWFNLPSTGNLLMSVKPSRMRWVFPGGKRGGLGLLTDWTESDAIEYLTAHSCGGRVPVFTGAFMIKSENGPRGSKIASVCRAITRVWNARDALVATCRQDCRLQALHADLMRFRGLGGFMAYEVVCDLQYTYLLENATDKDTWCNIGPGAKRGMNRMLGRPLEQSIPAPLWQRETAALLVELRRVFDGVEGAPLPNMRTTEHSLCEWDKYERALDIHVRGVEGGGRLKRRYNGR